MQKRGQKIKKGWWGFDMTAIDKKVKPQDDFYHYANGNWIKKTKIPKDESRWGSFITLRYDTEQQLKKIVEDLLKKKSYPKKYKQGSPEQLVSDYYRAASDMKTRNKLGMKPIEGLLKKIHDISSKEEYLETLAYLHVLGVSGLFGAFVDQDSKDSTKYILHLWQSGLGMPDRDYYTEDKPEQKRVRDVYKVHIEKLMQIAGKSETEAKQVREVVMDIETRMAQMMMKKEEMRDPQKIYNKFNLKSLQKLSPAVKWQRYFAQTGAEKAKNIIVGQPNYFKFVTKLIDTTPLADLKTYLEWHLINGSASMLSEKFVKENFDFYVTTLTGTKVMKPMWRRALAATNGALGDALGKIYVQKHFPASSKRQMDALVSDLFEVYAERIKKLDWMSAATKKKALVKLRAMNRKIGYPKKWRSYKDLVVLPADYVGNILRSSTHEHYRNMGKLGRPIDREEWFMSPQTVNAYFAPNLNDIVFPAAILQWPFFDPTADAAINYAAIGSVIGHEMTHGFDDQGAQYDNKGNLKNWWTAADKKKFEQKGKLVEKQADAFEVADGVKLSGKLTLGENIADLGGLVIAWDAYQKHLKRTGRKNIGGLTPEQRFFLGFAQMEQEMSRSEALKMRALTDPHATAPFRINNPVANFDPFFETYNVKKGHKMYRDSKHRARIW